MSVSEVINLAASLASLILAVLAIGLSVYFYTQSKNTETNISGALEGIRAQTDALQRIVGKQMTQLIRGVTEQPSPESSVYVEMISAIKQIPTNVTMLLQAPSSSSAAAAEASAQYWKEEAIRGYLGAYYYAAIANVANSFFLPSLEYLEQDNYLKTIQDTSYSNFQFIESWLSSLGKDLTKSNNYHLYEEATAYWKPHVKDSTAVYRERAKAATAPPAS